MMPWPWLSFLLPLLVAHLAGDFLFQTADDVRRKHEWKILLKHVAIHAAAMLILLGLWRFEALLATMAVALLHLGIDWLKSDCKNAPTPSLCRAPQRFSLSISCCIFWYFCWPQTTCKTSVRPNHSG